MTQEKKLDPREKIRTHKMKNFDPQDKIFDPREKIIDPLGHKSRKTLNP